MFLQTQCEIHIDEFVPGRLHSLNWHVMCAVSVQNSHHNSCMHQNNLDKWPEIDCSIPMPLIASINSVRCGVWNFCSRRAWTSSCYNGCAECFNSTIGHTSLNKVRKLHQMKSHKNSPQWILLTIQTPNDINQLYDNTTWVVLHSDTAASSEWIQIRSQQFG